MPLELPDEIVRLNVFFSRENVTSKRVMGAAVVIEIPPRGVCANANMVFKGVSYESDTSGKIECS